MKLLPDFMSLALCLLTALSLSAAWTLEPRRSASCLTQLDAVVSRRDFGWKAASLVSASTLVLFPEKPAWAKEEEGLLSVNNVADILHVVPTFTIVDAKGVPYMVVGEDA